MNKHIFIGMGAVVIALGGLYLITASRSSTSAAHTTTGAPIVQSASNTQVAPAFSLDRLDGGKVSLADYKGKKAVIVDFWTTWCPNCRRDIPHQNEWYKKYKDHVEVIGINMQEEPSVVKAYIEKMGIVYPIALDPSADTTHAYNANYTNYHVLIDTQGNIVKTIPGDISEQDFISLINS
jgi:thiol-disulfide isomerase/thioredoxin